MKFGMTHLMAGSVVLALIVAGAFALGMQWQGEIGSQEASASLASWQEATTTEEASEEIPTDLPLYPVVRVVDGDTIVVSIDGKNESVRMIGVDTPELNDSRTGVQCFATEASEKTKSLVRNAKVRLEKDESQGDRDRYKRLLAYVFREDGVFVNKALVAGGFAHEYTYDGPYAYQKVLKEAEASAREEGKGLWAADACPEPPPKRPAKSPASPKTSQTASAAAVSEATSQGTQNELQAQNQNQEPPPTPVPTMPQPMPVSEPPAMQPEPGPPPPTASFDLAGYTCSSNTYNCTDFKTKSEAQAVYEKCGGPAKDVHRLDNNKDGSACDSLP